LQPSELISPRRSAPSERRWIYIVADQYSALGTSQTQRICAHRSQLAGKSALSVAFNDRCDMVVATIVLAHDRPQTIEPGVIEFLNSRTVLHWAELALGI
jgi:hypothetical protein